MRFVIRKSHTESEELLKVFCKMSTTTHLKVIPEKNRSDGMDTRLQAEVTMHGISSCEPPTRPDPRVIIIRHFLSPIPDSKPSSSDDEPCRSAPAQTRRSEPADEVGYRADDDFDPGNNLEESPFGDGSPSASITRAPGRGHVTDDEGLSLPGSPKASLSSNPRDAGYDADDECDPIEFLASAILEDGSQMTGYLPQADLEKDGFGDRLISSSYLPNLALPNRTDALKDNTSSCSPFADDENDDEVKHVDIRLTDSNLTDGKCAKTQRRSSVASSSSGDDSDKSDGSERSLSTAVVVTPHDTQSRELERYDSESLAPSLPRIGLDNGDDPRDVDKNELLRQTAIAISGVLADLEVVETYERLGGGEFGEFLVEARPRELQDGPTLVAYQDSYGQLTVPLEMGCNQHAAIIIRKMIESRNIDPTVPKQRVSSEGHSCEFQYGDNFMFVSSSEAENDSDFVSCDEEELMALIAPRRGRKRGRDEIEDTDFEDEDDDDNIMRTPSNSRCVRQRLF